MASSSACRAKPGEWPALALKALRPPTDASLPFSTSVASATSCTTSCQVICVAPNTGAVHCKHGCMHNDNSPGVDL